MINNLNLIKNKWFNNRTDLTVNEALTLATEESTISALTWLKNNGQGNKTFNSLDLELFSPSAFVEGMFINYNIKKTL